MITILFWCILGGIVGSAFVCTIYSAVETRKKYILYDWRDFLCVYVDEHRLLSSFWIVFTLFSLFLVITCYFNL